MLPHLRRSSAGWKWHRRSQTLYYLVLSCSLWKFCSLQKAKWHMDSFARFTDLCSSVSLSFWTKTVTSRDAERLHRSLSVLSNTLLHTPMQTQIYNPWQLKWTLRETLDQTTITLVPPVKGILLRNIHRNMGKNFSHPPKKSKIQSSNLIEQHGTVWRPSGLRFCGSKSIPGITRTPGFTTRTLVWESVASSAGGFNVMADRLAPLFKQHWFELCQNSECRYSTIFTHAWFLQGKHRCTLWVSTCTYAHAHTQSVGPIDPVTFVVLLQDDAVTHNKTPQ